MFISNLWYVAAWNHDLDNEPLGCVITGVPVVLYRRADGVAIGLEDRSPHRFATLSNDRIEGDNLRCVYHGLRFGCDGVCNEMPARDQAPVLRVRTFPVVERWDWVWVWMANPQILFARYDNAEDRAQKAFLAMRGVTDISLLTSLQANNQDIRSQVNNFHPYCWG